jgi:hypothetical protein
MMNGAKATAVNSNAPVPATLPNWKFLKKLFIGLILIMDILLCIGLTDRMN